MHRMQGGARLRTETRTLTERLEARVVLGQDPPQPVGGLA